MSQFRYLPGSFPCCMVSRIDRPFLPDKVLCLLSLGYKTHVQPTLLNALLSVPGGSHLPVNVRFPSPPTNVDFPSPLTNLHFSSPTNVHF